MSKSVPPTEKRVGYKRVVVATARDEFQVAFSTAEITEGMGKTRAFLVDDPWEAATRCAGPVAPGGSQRYRTFAKPLSAKAEEMSST